jgi:hypothetical protein
MDTIRHVAAIISLFFSTIAIAAAGPSAGGADVVEQPPSANSALSDRLAATAANGDSPIDKDYAGQWLDDAEALMADRRFMEAAALLSAGVDQMPNGWQSISKDGDRVVLAAWDLGEFLGFSKDSDPLSGPGVVWVAPSYSKAHYLLAVIGVETGDVQGAVHHIVRAIELQPDHPLVIHEAAIILRGIGAPPRHSR